MKLKSLASLLLLALVATGCGLCSDGRGGRSAESFIAADASSVVSVPSVGTLAARLTSLSDNLRSGPAGQKLVQAMATVARQVGFNPFTKEGLASAGIDPTGSLALGAGAAGRANLLLALPVSDKAKAIETVTRLVKDRSGAGVTETRDVNGTKVSVLVREAGGAPQLSYAYKDGFLLLATGVDTEAEVAAAVARTSEQSIAKFESFASAKKRVGNRELYVMLPREAARRLAMMPDSAVVGVGVTDSELSVRSYVHLEPAQAGAVKEALAGGGRTLLPLLPANSPVYLRGGLNLAAMLARYENAGDDTQYVNMLRDTAKQAGFDVDAELLANVEPGFAVAVGLSSTAKLASAFDFDPRRSNPFDTYTVVGVGQVKDAAKAQATLAKLPALAETMQVQISEREVAGHKVWTASYRLGEGLTWALVGKRLVIAGGLGATFDTFVASLAKGTEQVKADAFGARARQALFADSGVALALDLGRVNELVTKLPTSAFGPGAGGMMARSVATGMIAPLARLRGVVAITPVDGGVLFDVSATAQPAP